MCGGDGEAKAPEENQGEYRVSTSTGITTQQTGQPDRDGNGDVTVAGDGEERRQGQSTTTVERQKQGRRSEENGEVNEMMHTGRHGDSPGTIGHGGGAANFWEERGDSGSAILRG